MEEDKQPYLKCEIGKEFLGGIIVSFDSVYFGYPSGDCLVVKEHLKQDSDSSGLVKIIGDTNKFDGRHKVPDNREYVYIKLNSILDGGWAHFLVPKENVVYI